MFIFIFIFLASYLQSGLLAPVCMSEIGQSMQYSAAKRSTHPPTSPWSSLMDLSASVLNNRHIHLLLTIFVSASLFNTPRGPPMKLCGLPLWWWANPRAENAPLASLQPHACLPAWIAPFLLGQPHRESGSLSIQSWRNRPFIFSVYVHSMWECGAGIKPLLGLGTTHSKDAMDQEGHAGQGRYSWRLRSFQEICGFVVVSWLFVLVYNFLPSVLVCCFKPLFYETNPLP